MNNFMITPSGTVPTVGTPGVLFGNIFVPVVRSTAENTLLLMHFNGDLSYSGTLADKLTIGLFGGAYISDADSKFGTGALRLTGSSADYLKINPSLDFGLTGELTVDFQLKTVGAYNHTGFFYMGGSWSAGTLAVHTNNGNYWMQPGSQNPNNTPVIANEWHHVEYSRDASSVFRLFVNGVKIGQFADAYGYPWLNTDFYIGAPGAGFGNPLNAYVDELRISQVCRHTNNFAPPAAPYSVD